MARRTIHVRSKPKPNQSIEQPLIMQQDIASGDLAASLRRIERTFSENLRVRKLKADIALRNLRHFTLTDIHKHSPHYLAGRYKEPQYETPAFARKPHKPKRYTRQEKDDILDEILEELEAVHGSKT